MVCIVEYSKSYNFWTGKKLFLLASFCLFSKWVSHLFLYSNHSENKNQKAVNNLKQETILYNLFSTPNTLLHSHCLNTNTDRCMVLCINFFLTSAAAVSYTHLDVYKRQLHMQLHIWSSFILTVHILGFPPVRAYFKSIFRLECRHQLLQDTIGKFDVYLR